MKNRIAGRLRPNGTLSQTQDAEVPAYLIERNDHLVSGDAIWAKDREQAQTFLRDGELAVHAQSDVIAEMMKIPPVPGRHPEAFYTFMITPRSISGEDLPHRP